MKFGNPLFRPAGLHSASPVDALACILCLASIFGSPAKARARPFQRQSPASNSVTPAQAELTKRVGAAQQAKGSNDPAEVEIANRRLIALALRQIGQLRLVESAYPQAVELYRHSLEFENIPATRVDLAIAEMQSNQPADAIKDADQALVVAPNDVRAWSVRGRASAMKRDYPQAAEALEHVVRVQPDIETLYMYATYLLGTKSPSDKQRAEQVFEQMKQTAGDSGALHVLFGRAYRDGEDLPTAIREFQTAIQLDPRAQHAHYFLGLARLASNEWKATPAVEQEFATELKYYPRDYLTNYMLGFVASGERRYEESDRYLKTAAELNPKAPEPWLYMGLNAFGRNDNAQAEPLFRKAIELTGNDEARSNYQIRRAYTDLGRILSISGRAEEAERYLTKARELQNRIFKQGQQNMAEMVLAGGAGSAAAVVPLGGRAETESAPVTAGNADPFARIDASMAARALSEEERTSADSQENHLRGVLGLAFNDLGTSEAIRGEYLNALERYQETEKWDSSIPGLFKNLGLAAYRAGDYSEAVRGLLRASSENPDDAPLRAMLGMAQFGGARYADAVKTFTPLGQRGMQDSHVGYAWASSLARVGSLKTAGEVLSEFEKANNSKEALLLTGQLWIDVGDYARAVRSLHAALDADPLLQKAHYFAGQADIRWEHWADAAEEFQSELKLDSSNLDAKYNLGFVYLQQSRVEDALKIFQDVVAASPEHANAQYQLGKILLDRGQLAEAVGHLEVATRLSPQSDYMHYQLQTAYRKQDRNADADRELALYKELKAKKREQAAAQVQQNP